MTLDYQLKKGPVSAAEQAQIQADFQANMTTEAIGRKFQRSPKVIQKVLSDLQLKPTESPSEQRRKLRIVLDVDLIDIRIALPNGVKYTFELPGGLDATNNSAILEQIQAQLQEHQSETNSGLTLQDKEADLYA